MRPIANWCTSYMPCPNNTRVQTSDGTLLILASIGTINRHPIGKLAHELHIPKIFISLISVQRIAFLIPEKIEFEGINAFLCNKVQEWKIGLARVHEGLYYFPSNRNTKEPIRSTINNEMCQSNVLSIIDARLIEDKVWLIHHKLGHPSFQILENTCFLMSFKDLKLNIMYAMFVKKLNIRGIHINL